MSSPENNRVYIQVASNASRITFDDDERAVLKYKKAGNAFVKKHRERNDLEWLHASYEYRSAIDPALFEYYERRAAGTEPEPTNFTFPMRPIVRRYHRHIRQMRIRREKVQFRDIDWNRGFSYRDADVNYDTDGPNGFGMKNEVKVEGGWLDPPEAPWGQDYDDMEDLDKAVDEDATVPSLETRDNDLLQGGPAGALEEGQRKDSLPRASKEANDEEVGPLNETIDQILPSGETRNELDNEDVDPSTETAKELAKLAQQGCDIIQSIESNADNQEVSSHDRAEAIAQWVGMSTEAPKGAEEPPTSQSDEMSRPTSVDKALMGLLEDMDDGRKASHEPDTLETWSKEDKETLFDWVHEHNIRDWTVIASLVARTEEQCQAMYRQIAHLNVEHVSEDVWTANEDADLIRWVDDYKVDDWIRIAFHMSRTDEDCRQRYDQLLAGLPDSASKGSAVSTSDDNAGVVNAPPEAENEDRGPSVEPGTTARAMRPILALTIPEGATPGENNQYRGQKRVRELEAAAEGEGEGEEQEEEGGGEEEEEREEAEPNSHIRTGIMTTTKDDRPRRRLKRARFTEPNEELARPNKARRTGKSKSVSGPWEKAETAKDDRGRSRKRARDTEESVEEDQDKMSKRPTRRSTRIANRITNRIANQPAQVPTQGIPQAKQTNDQKLQGRKRVREAEEDVESEQDASTARSKRPRRAAAPRTRKQASPPAQQTPHVIPAKPQTDGRVLRSSTRIAKKKSDYDRIYHSATTKAVPKVAKSAELVNPRGQALDGLERAEARETSPEPGGETTRGRRKVSKSLDLKGPAPPRVESHATGSDKGPDEGSLDEKGRSKYSGARRFGADRRAERYNLRPRPAR